MARTIINTVFFLAFMFFPCFIAWVREHERQVAIAGLCAVIAIFQGSVLWIGLGEIALRGLLAKASLGVTLTNVVVVIAWVGLLFWAVLGKRTAATGAEPAEKIPPSDPIDPKILAFGLAVVIIAIIVVYRLASG